MESLNYLISKYNLIIHDRGYTEIPNAGRKEMAEFFNDVGFQVGAEIGVEQGIYSEILCNSIPNLQLHCIDAWQAYSGYRDHVGEEKLEEFYQITAKRLSRFNVILHREFSMEAVKKFDDQSLDFVYIDANHELPWIMDDIFWWDRKVKPGGVISGHDYYKSKRPYTKCHVKYTVDCYTQAFRVRPWFIWGIQEKNNGMIRDTPRSWMWFKRPIQYGEYMRFARE